MNKKTAKQREKRIKSLHKEQLHYSEGIMDDLDIESHTYEKEDIKSWEIKKSQLLRWLRNWYCQIRTNKLK